MNAQIVLPSGLILGLGVGVFVLLVLAIIILIIWLATIYATKTEKILWRGISVTIFAIIVILLVFSERESRDLYTGYEKEIHDMSIIPRIVIASILIFFSLIAGVLLFDESGVSKETNTVDVEYTALWQS